MNISASATTSRQVAAGTVRGGRMASEAMIAAPAVSSSTAAITCPARPVSASRWPGSGLTAREETLASPSGNAIVFCTSDPGARAATGPTRAVATASVAAPNRAAARRPSLAATITMTITSAGHAVAFIPAATPSASAARYGRGCRHSSASPRQSRPSTGTSVPPTVSESAISGEDVTSMVQRSASLDPATSSAEANAATNASANQIRGSVAGEVPSSALGTPNSDMTGRYGSKTLGLWAAAVTVAGW